MIINFISNVNNNVGVNIKIILLIGAIMLIIIIIIKIIIIIIIIVTYKVLWICITKLKLIFKFSNK